MTGISEGMPVLARHIGSWTGDYVVADSEGCVIDRHRADLICMFPTSGPYPYFQKNVYTWPDGRREEHDFPALYRDNRLWWDTERIVGSAREIDERTILLSWNRKTMPGTYFYEMIQISEDNGHRARTWHLFENDRLVNRTIIQERRVS